VALERDGRLLTAGEACVVRRLLALPTPAGSLYARLFGRRRRVFVLADLSYAEIPDVEAAADTLLDAGLAWSAQALAPLPLLLEAHTVPELKDICRALGRPVSGRRHEIAARLLDQSADPLLRRKPALMLRHRGLMRRLARLYLMDSTGDLSRLTVARLGMIRYPAYTPTGGGGLFCDRGEMLAWEAALLRWFSEPDPVALVMDLPRSLAALRRVPLPPPHRRRMSARRFDERAALSAAQHLERAGEHALAARVYREILDCGARESAHATLRLAMCLGRTDGHAEGAALCRGARDAAGPVMARSLDRTGRRLARKARLPWATLPKHQAPPERRLTLTAATRRGSRPLYRVGGANVPVEEALVRRLAAAGRRAVHCEGAPWHTLFGLLLREAIFAPVPGMLPAPLLFRPLDFGGADFYANRRAQIDAILADVAERGAAERLERALEQHAGEAIIGVRWDLFTPAQLLELADALGGAVLAALLRPFAEDWSGAAAGMPDLCILPGPSIELDGGALGEGLHVVEVKGPRDRLRDAQRIWMDRLLVAGVSVELWTISPASEAPG